MLLVLYLPSKHLGTVFVLLSAFQDKKKTQLVQKKVSYAPTFFGEKTNVVRVTTAYLFAFDSIRNRCRKNFLGTQF